jgi:hypothetical protein
MVRPVMLDKAEHVDHLEAHPASLQGRELRRIRKEVAEAPGFQRQRFQKGRVERAASSFELPSASFVSSGLIASHSENIN